MFDLYVINGVSFFYFHPFLPSRRFTMSTDSSEYSLPTQPVRVEDPMEVLMSPRYRDLRIGPRTELAPPLSYFQLVQVKPESLFESCLVRAAFSGVAGLGLGALMGGFFHTMQPVDVLENEKLSFREQVRLQYKGFGANCIRMSKGFAKVGLVYSGIECAIERERAQRDIPNAIYAGCLTGAVLAYQGGPQAMGMGCAGFAVFSAAIEAFMAH
jgi:mitochondrial import inner membrane translocase subunit TIM22